VRLRGAALASAAALVLASGAAATSDGACTLSGPLGKGASQVWLLIPDGEPRSVVVYAHGWTATSPHDWHRARMDHLCARGSAVVFPRYQRGGYDDTFPGSVAPFRAGLAAAFARLDRPRLPVVASGFSFGATLVFYYAANAGRWGLPVPGGVYSIFPTGPIPGVRLGPLPRTARYVVLAGDRDEVVGRAGADAFWQRLARHPAARKQYRLVRSGAGLLASHEAPKETSSLALRTFWAPLDALVGRVRR
jgi:alpha-beta hydrolase superfamily lysophospholipase